MRYYPPVQKNAMGCHGGKNIGDGLNAPVGRKAERVAEIIRIFRCQNRKQKYRDEDSSTEKPNRSVCFL